tara:strand:+ start:26452 stop:27294 length:843 start_codon:yes stop_codon:yes gene_type:complete
VKFRRIKKIFSRDKYATPAYDLSNENTPLDLIYSDFKGDIAIVPIENCRSYMLGFTTEGNPFIKTLKEYSKNKSHYLGSTLEKYYNNYCPKSMQEVLKSSDNKLNNYHPMATVLPWSTLTPEEKLPRTCVNVSAQNLLSKEAYKLGLSEKDSYGWQFFGPVSKSLGLQEYQRLVTTYNSIKVNGYKPLEHGHIDGHFLISDDTWVWVSYGGKHRFASLAALNLKHLPVALKSKSSALFIRRAEVESWPNVKNGLFSKSDTLNIFDHTLKGNSYHSLTINK